MTQQLSFNDYDKKEETADVKNHNYKVVINKKNEIDYKYFLSHDKAKEFVNKKKKELDDSINIGIVYKEPQPKPEDKKGKGLWCPFCTEYRKFNSSGKKVDTCNYCNISKKNYYVKKENNLWNRE